MNLSELLTGGNVTVASIVWPLMIGIFLAVVISHINKRTVGRLVKKLLDDSCDSPESAKSLKELGLESKSFLKYALRPASTLSSLILNAEGTDKYYIPSEKAFRAENTYVSDRTSYVTLIIAAAIFFALGIGLNNVVPKIIEYSLNIF